ncbi:hypothetical protein GCM10008929_16630 [Alkalibacterium psychrotolerans]
MMCILAVASMVFLKIYLIVSFQSQLNYFYESERKTECLQVEDEI